MVSPTSVPHPLLRRPGTSQGKRKSDASALQSDFAPIDDRSLADFLNYIHQYARLVIFPERKLNEAGEEDVITSDWLTFFESSLPFRLAQFSKIDFSSLEKELGKLIETIEQIPADATLRLLFDFCFFELLSPLEALHTMASEYEWPLHDYLDNTIRESLVAPVRRYIILSNTAHRYFGAARRPFFSYSQPPWSIDVLNVFDADEDITLVPGGRTQAIIWLSQEVATTITAMLRVLRRIGEAVASHLPAALTILQGRQEPHLGVLFAFLRLFQHFQSDLNQLTKKHLDFFYQEILRFKPRELVPDRAHLVLEVAKQKESYPVAQGVAFKDGKDSRNADILFRLDEETVIDCARVVELRTLFLNTVPALWTEKEGEESTRRRVLEGVYIAPVAKSADGKGKDFREEQSKNWPTLGAKFSKLIRPGEDQPTDYPFARLGFILSSPVLWLNEGTRHITVTLTCEAFKDADILSTYWENHGKATAEMFYSISAQTIARLENFFSPPARAYLQAALASSPSGAPIDLNAKSAKGLFTWNERAALIYLLDGAGDFLMLREMPFVSLIRHLNALRQIRDPYPIGSEAEAKAFLQSKAPLLCEKLISTVLPLFDGSPVGADWFIVKFSGEKEWFQAKPKSSTPFKDTKTASKNGKKTAVLSSSTSPVQVTCGVHNDKRLVTLTLCAELGADEPRVAFYNEEALQEKLDIDRPFPMVWIELNPEIRMACEHSTDVSSNQCDLAIGPASGPVKTALYQFFRYLKVRNARIDVTVCGMRTMIVQNENSLQDVNSPISPFGPRPVVGSQFYIGNKELFCKNWQKFWIRTTWKDKPSSLQKHYEYYGSVAQEQGQNLPIDQRSFRFEPAILQDRLWHERKKPKDPTKQREPRYLFLNDLVVESSCREKTPPQIPPQPAEEPFLSDHKRDVPEGSEFYHEFHRDQFDDLDLAYNPKSLTSEKLAPLNVQSDTGFMSITLRGTSFQHQAYPFVLAGTLFELSDMLNPLALDKLRESVKTARELQTRVQEKVSIVKKKITEAVSKVNTARGLLAPNTTGGLRELLDEIDEILGRVAHAVWEGMENWDFGAAFDDLDLAHEKVTACVAQLDGLAARIEEIHDILTSILDVYDGDELIAGLTKDILSLQATLEDVHKQLNSPKKDQRPDEAGIPKEPYTPLIKNLVMDYEATSGSDDIDLIHLYPFEKTSKKVYLTFDRQGGMAPEPAGATLFPTHDDEGTLFIGLEKVRPGANLQLLFQLAEATADSESARADIHWYYLTGNQWLPLRLGFEISADATERMTRSGIVKIALPRDFSNVGNTLMPASKEGEPLYWLKVSTSRSVAAVAEALGVHAQAAVATYWPKGNDPLRVGTPLAPLQIGKPVEPDFNIKKVEQPYESFGGRPAEEKGSLSARISEHLRHKGRGIDIFDIEHLVLDRFPQLYKCKCISHTLGLSAHEYRRDLEVAPGFLVVAVVPDLTKLKVGDNLLPKAPVSLLSEVETFLRERSSPFARIRVMNPRYEPIEVKITVRLRRGRDESYYAAKLKTDLTQYLAPWYLGDSSKISFGQHVVYSDVLHFVEELNYIDFITHLELMPSGSKFKKSAPPPSPQQEIIPSTARSILTGGQIYIELDRPNCQPSLLARAHQSS